MINYFVKIIISNWPVPASFLCGVCESSGCMPHCQAGASGSWSQAGSREKEGHDAAGAEEPKGGAGLFLGICEGEGKREAASHVN